MTQLRKNILLDTDIGTDIDDTWALGLLLNCPELQLGFVLAATGDTLYRARLTCRILDEIGHSEVPVGVGIPTDFSRTARRQEAWVGNYQLGDYPGKVHQDGIQAAGEWLRSTEDATIITIGPLTNVAALCARHPDLISRCHLISMLGSIARGHRDAEGVISEYNVCGDIRGAQAVFKAPWKSVTITPLDSCGNIILAGERYQRFLASNRPIPRCIRENYSVWRKLDAASPPLQSSVLFDTVAIYLAFAEELLVMRELCIEIDDAGFMRKTAAGRPVRTALDWKDKEAYLDLLLERLIA